jgi:glucokinase
LSTRTLSCGSTGTGLGVAGVLPGVGDAPRDAVHVLASQGGHVGFAPADEVEVELLRFMQAQLGVVTAEDLISGRGLVQLYRFFAGRSAAPAASLTPAEVGAHAVAGDDAAAVEAVLRFWALLGGFAADVALLYGAWGGVYVGGGIAPRLLALFERSDFRARFTARPAMAEVLVPLPIWLIDDPHAALRGAAAVLRSPGFK